MTNNPFDRAYVVRMTLKGMRSSVDFSTRKTLFRLKDFGAGDEKRDEIMETLSTLSSLNKLIDDFESHNKHLLK